MAGVCCLVSDVSKSNVSSVLQSYMFDEEQKE